MSKTYVKDEKGKYHLVDKQEPQAQAQTLSLEELDARLKRVERIVIDPITKERIVIDPRK